MDEQKQPETNPEIPVTKPEEKPKKKSHKLRWTLIILLIIFVVLPILFIGYTGLFNIPGLTHLFGSNKPIDLDVEISEAAVASGMAKTPWGSIDGLPEPPSASSPFDIDRVYTGSVPVINDVTSEEFTSFLDNRLQNVDIFDSMQVRFYDGGAEASFQFKEYIDMPVYIKSDITTSGGSMVFDVQSIKVGRLPIPQNYVDQFEEAATELINERMDEVSGFSFERLEFKDNYVDFQGTYPETIELAN